MFHLTRNQRDHTCRKRTCLLPVVLHVMFHHKAEAAVKTEVSECSAQLHMKEQITGVPGTAGAAGLSKG